MTCKSRAGTAKRLVPADPRASAASQRRVAGLRRSWPRAASVSASPPGPAPRRWGPSLRLGAGRPAPGWLGVRNGPFQAALPLSPHVASAATSSCRVRTRWRAHRTRGPIGASTLSLPRRASSKPASPKRTRRLDSGTKELRAVRRTNGCMKLGLGGPNAPGGKQSGAPRQVGNSAPGLIGGGGNGVTGGGGGVTGGGGGVGGFTGGGGGGGGGRRNVASPGSPETAATPRGLLEVRSRPAEKPRSWSGIAATATPAM